MKEQIESLIAEIAARFGSIRVLSEWRAISSLDTTEKVEEILDARQVILNEIETLKEKILTQYPEDSLKDSSIYATLKDEVEKINAADRFFMEKIRERMSFIKSEIQSRSIFRQRALPGYLRQKMAFAVR
ncbi:MAG: hypothetical protein JNL74_15000 [Fibrobacteres bacterium]|nr:hypothetical protein [Fibrobacterota bacterium]